MAKEHAKWMPYLVGHHMLMAHAETYRLYQKQFREKQQGQPFVAIFVSFS